MRRKLAPVAERLLWRGLPTAPQTPLAAIAILALLISAGCQTVPDSVRSAAFQSPTPADSREAMYPSLKLNDDLIKWLRPSNQRDWAPELAVMAHADIRGRQVTVQNIRDCRWRTANDFRLRYYNRTFDLDKLRHVDFVVVPFNELPSIGHTMLSFVFDDGETVAVSVEIRRERNEAFNPVKGFFRQYEIMYVVATERDVIGRRVDCDLCDVFLYHSTATPEQARKLFVDMMKRVNKLDVQPEFYDTLTNNCTTNIRSHINHLYPDSVPYDYRVLLPGYSDHLAYDLGLIEKHGSYEDTRQRARVNYVAYLHRDAPDFSRAIRR
ncbi:MAG: DUF4105 domain-containing protein [Planctomycetaceae bacterium]|nr:DUF4105 domain-containing protein [Planctomycetaceae bacterium]